MSTLYMAWRGVEDDQNLYWAVSFDGKWWSPQIQLSDRASDDAPALAVFQGKLFMAWRGAGNDNLWWATYDGNIDLKWSDQQQLTDRGSIEGPALAVYENKLFMAWRGVSGDQRLYWATYDESDPRKWTDQHSLGLGSSFDVPGLGVFQNRFFMAWRGVEGDQDLYWTTYNDAQSNFGPNQSPLTDRGSTEGPALVAFQGKLYMIWRGISDIDEDDRSLYWATYDQNDPRGWTNQSVMEGPGADQSGAVVVGSVHRPSLVGFQNGIFVAGAGYSLATSTGLPTDILNSDSLAPGPNPDPSGPPLPQGPDEDPGGPPPPPPPKGLFYATFDGSVPVLPITLFTDRASERPVAQAVYVDIPLSLRSLLSKHNFDPTKGLRTFVGGFSPGLSSTTPILLRSFVGF